MMRRCLKFRRKWESERRALLEADANVWKRFKLKLEEVENGWSEECRYILKWVRIFFP